MMSQTLPQTENDTLTTTISQPKLLLHLEGLAFLIAAILAYAHLGGSLWMFLLLLFVPDVGMVGYFINTRIGAWLYNIVHFYATPGVLLAAALSAGWLLGVQIALIWVAHIAMDRTVGYGFKYTTQFKDTHLGRL